MPLPPLSPDPVPTRAQLEPYTKRAIRLEPDRAKLWAADEWKKDMRKAYPNMFRQPNAFEGLRAYRDTPLWREIRLRVLKAHNGRCAACSSSANEVHHRDYRQRVLDGNDDDALVPLCRRCHELVHFGGDYKQEESRLLAMVRAKDKDPTRGPGLPPPFKKPKRLPSDIYKNRFWIIPGGVV